MMTQTADRVDRVVDSLAVEPLPKRSILRRLSLGHLIMVLAGLLAFLLVLAVLREQDEIVQIAVAARQIDAGTELEDADVRYADLSDADRALLSAFFSPAGVDGAIREGWVATRTVPPGVPLTRSDFRREAITADLRAMSIPVSTQHAVNGAIVPGDRIDIIVVRRGLAAYVATAVEVIAVADRASTGRSEFALTVAVDAATSLRVAAAINDGSIEVVRATGAAAANPDAVFPEAVPVSPADGD
jgi:Flp pilus assembly protein CpaB